MTARPSDLRTDEEVRLLRALIAPTGLPRWDVIFVGPDGRHGVWEAETGAVRSLSDKLQDQEVAAWLLDAEAR